MRSATRRSSASGYQVGAHWLHDVGRRFDRALHLTESLQQQTATANVLKVISRATFDLPTVLDALLRSAGSLCEADMGAVLRPESERFIFAANFGFPQAFIDLVKDLPLRPVEKRLLGE
jgi:two-component system NtrC family sensor kinase